MEGDLLGLGFEQSNVSNTSPQEVQQFESTFLQLHHLSGHVAPPSQFQTSSVQQLPFVNVHQPPAQFQNVAVQQQESSVLQQSLQETKPDETTVVSKKSVEDTQNLAITEQKTANISPTTNEVWKPSPLQDGPSDPILREIKEKFSGRWKLIRSDPYDEYLKAAGVGFFARKLAISRAPEQEISIKGNKIHIDFRSTFHNQIQVFVLEESVENVVETTRQSIFCSYKDGQLTLLMTPLEPGLNRTQEVQRYISEHGELVVMYTCGTSTCRRYFARIADTVAPLNIVG
ncbi:unnamed protein product [Candidula unifasciata]|uniref:Uncharacterized protein n=1 Tax=Candidula unifasciata TaxID=100452 RepID=A0A8S3YRF6_9EUPU|nr:unnamed protein product [Candidula unifasciata]